MQPGHQLHSFAVVVGLGIWFSLLWLLSKLSCTQPEKEYREVVFRVVGIFVLALKRGSAVLWHQDMKDNAEKKKLSEVSP